MAGPLSRLFLERAVLDDPELAAFELIQHLRDPNVCDSWSPRSLTLRTSILC